MANPGTLPASIAPLRGTIRFAWTGHPRVRPLAEDGTPGAPLHVRRAGKGLWELRVDDTVRTPWLLVETR